MCAPLIEQPSDLKIRKKIKITPLGDDWHGFHLFTLKIKNVLAMGKKVTNSIVGVSKLS